MSKIDIIRYIGIYKEVSLLEFIGNRYEILNEEDSIESDKIYIARDVYENKKVLLKVINHNKHISEDFMSNLIDESTMLGETNSPYILKILDVGMHCTEEYTLYYIVSEYTDGIILKNLISGNYLHIEGIVNISTQIVKALEFAHNYNFYHGSLRTDNIIVDSQYRVKVCDFGLVKANKGVYLRSSEDIRYMTPHQLCVDYTDKESDFFTLGVILFEMIFKKFPFEIYNSEKEMLKSINKGVSWIDAVAVNGNDDIINVAKKLLERTDKYLSTQEIILDLSKIMYNKANIDDEEGSDLDFEDISNKKGSLRKGIIGISLLILVSIIITGCFII